MAITTSTIISLAALAISLFSLAFSIYFGLRDRCRLVTESQFFPEDEYGPACVQVKVVNAGRRVAILKYFGGDFIGGGGLGTMIGEDASGLQLGEQESYERRFDWDSLHLMPEEGGVVNVYENFWVEDTLGRRHVVKKSKKNIKKLLEVCKDQLL